MKLVCMALFDVQAQSFGQPFFVATEGVGLRMVTDLVNRPSPDNQVGMHPRDFRVFRLAEWNDADGMFVQKSLPELVIDCQALKEGGSGMSPTELALHSKSMVS